MAKTTKKYAPNRNAKPAPAVEAPAVPSGLRVIGSLLLLAAIAASFILALDHFALYSPPGCGPQSGCDQATRSAWGTIPGIDWPTSLLGVAYFGGMLIAWLASSRGINTLLRAIAWLGLAGSVVFVIVMLQHGFICKYCLASHIANLLFVGVMEVAASKTRSSEQSLSRAPLRAGLLAFIVLSIGMGVAHAQTKARRIARDEAERKSITDEIARKSQRDSATAATQSGATQSTASQPTDTNPPVANVAPFTGRWRLGPEKAPIRIVMFMDYQCKDCQIMESQAIAVTQRRSDVSLSVKHFPMCADCNPHISGSRMHPNACWAARAAETAGILQGNDGFWKMHNWLFQRQGSFTDQDFPPALQQMGFNAQEFLTLMQRNDTLRNVLADVDEGIALGLHFTPLIFINGVELRGFIGNPGALTRTVDDLVARNLPPGDAAMDHPSPAIEKIVQDWRSNGQASIPPDATPHTRGSQSAKTRIVVWGDLQEKYTAELDRAIQAEIAAGRDVLYEFRQFPVDQACNPATQRTAHPTACVAARAAEAAASLGGEEAYWKMHNWLLANQSTLNDDALKKAAAETGLDAAALLAAMNSPAVNAAIADDTTTGATRTISGVIPSLHINGRWAPRWKAGDKSVLPQLLDAAARGP